MWNNALFEISQLQNLSLASFVFVLIKATMRILNVLLNLSPVRVITKLPNSEISSKRKVKTNKYTNRQNQSTTGKLGKS